jgi:PilZ domain
MYQALLSRVPLQIGKSLLLLRFVTCRKLGVRYRSMNWPIALPGAGVKSEREKNDRRQADRFPIEREVRYKVLNRKNADEIGFGKTINMSSNGVLFTTEQYLLPGRRLELSISWPAQLNSTVALKLVARGRVVRCEEGKAAIEIHQYEFRTASQSSTTVN